MTRPQKLAALALALATGLAVGSCGRRGPLEPPPAAAPAPAAEASSEAGYRATTTESEPWKPAAAVKPPLPAAKTFPLDPLL